MSCDEQLVARIRTLLANRTDISERKMFGGLTFMIAGNTCCGVNGDELIVRLDSDEENEALARPHARPMDLTGRPMRGFITVRPDGLKVDRLDQRMHETVARAESIPPRWNNLSKRPEAAAPPPSPLRFAGGSCRCQTTTVAEAAPSPGG